MTTQVKEENTTQSSATKEIPYLFLTPGMEREQMFARHPVVTDKAKLPTPPIKESFEVISSAIIHHMPGVCFAAEARYGKTYGIAHLLQALPQRFPHLPIYSVNAKEHDRPSERTFYTDLLQDCGHGLSDSGTAAARRQRLLNLWFSRTQAVSSNQLLIFVDEAQNWNEYFFTFLRDLSNDLASRDVGLIVVLFAHPSFLIVRTSLLAGQRTDLIGRFMLHPTQFRGVSSQNDLIEIAKCYDNPDISEFPPGTGISYSQFFRPDAFSMNNWRLESEAVQCWSAFTQASKKQSGHFQIGMQWIANAIRDYFYTYWNIEHGEVFPDKDLWEKAVESSGYLTTLGVIKD